MVNNTNITKNGFNIMINRGFNDTPTASVPDRFKISINTPDVSFTDTDLETAVPIIGTETVDDCSVVTGWTGVTCTISSNTSTFKPDAGTDGALNVIKSSTTSNSFNVSKTTTSLDGTSKDLLVWLYIDSGALVKIASTTSVLIRFGSDSTNYYEKAVHKSSLSAGWNFLKTAITSGFNRTNGSPAISALDYTYLGFQTANVSDTLAAGDLVFDSIRLASADDYFKDVDSLSHDTTDASVTILKRLSVTEANGFLIDGSATFNDDSMFSKEKIFPFSKSSTELVKITEKFKFRNING